MPWGSSNSPRRRNSSASFLPFPPFNPQNNARAGFDSTPATTSTLAVCVWLVILVSVFIPIATYNNCVSRRVLTWCLAGVASIQALFQQRWDRNSVPHHVLLRPLIRLRLLLLDRPLQRNRQDLENYERQGETHELLPIRRRARSRNPSNSPRTLMMLHRKPVGMSRL